MQNTQISIWLSKWSFKHVYFHNSNLYNFTVNGNITYETSCIFWLSFTLLTDRTTHDATTVDGCLTLSSGLLYQSSMFWTFSLISHSNYRVFPPFRLLLPRNTINIQNPSADFLLTGYYMPPPDVTVMVIALSALTMWRKQSHHFPYSLLKISFCFHLFANTELSTCNSMSVSTALERFLHLFHQLCSY